MLISRSKIKGMLTSADWETVFADTGKSYVELYDTIYDPYVHEHCFTDDDIVNCNYDQETWAVQHYMYTFADTLAIYLLEQELAPILGSDYGYKICAMASEIAECDRSLPLENIQVLIDTWCREQELVEVSLLHLYTLLEEMGNTDQAKDTASAAAEQLVHWHIYRNVLVKMQRIMLEKTVDSAPPRRRQGESIEDYKARLTLYLNSLDDAVCDTTPNSDMATDPF